MCTSFISTYYHTYSYIFKIINLTLKKNANLGGEEGCHKHVFWIIIFSTDKRIYCVCVFLCLTNGDFIISQMLITYICELRQLNESNYQKLQIDYINLRLLNLHRFLKLSI